MQGEGLTVFNNDSAKGLVDGYEVLEDLIKVVSLGLLSEEFEGERFPVVDSVIVNSHRHEFYVFLVIGLQVDFDHLIE